MIKEKPIKDWEKILLDTSIICALFSSENKESKDQDIKFTRKLIDFLTRQKTGENKERMFLKCLILLK